MAKEQAAKEAEVKPEEMEMCGIVMPIAAFDGYTETHWMNVRQIIKTAAQNAGYKSDLVSNGIDGDIIHKRIVQNLIDNPIVVVDISGRNPNVMFEMGMRLTFDKAIVLIRDNTTNVPFDTNIIEYLTYPKSLNYAEILVFIEQLTDRIKQVALESKKQGYSSFLNAFGTFKTGKPKMAQPEIEKVGELELLRDDMKEIKKMLSSQTAFPRMKSKQAFFERKRTSDAEGYLSLEMDQDSLIKFDNHSGELYHILGVTFGPNNSALVEVKYYDSLLVFMEFLRSLDIPYLSLTTIGKP